MREITAESVFADPVAYLAMLGISAELVVTETALPVAA